MMTIIIMMITIMGTMTMNMTITSSFIPVIPILHPIFIVSIMVLDMKSISTATLLYFFDNFILLKQMFDQRGGLMC